VVAFSTAEVGRLLDLVEAARDRDPELEVMVAPWGRDYRVAAPGSPRPVHAWRHAAGTTLFHATKDIKAVQNRLGHSTAAITMNLYVHGTEEADREAAAHFEAARR
jgi:integrase